MHMRFLSRGFKNLQWYGMTLKPKLLRFSRKLFCFAGIISCACMGVFMCKGLLCIRDRIADFHTWFPS